MVTICTGILLAQSPTKPTGQPASEHGNARRQMEESLERQKQAIRWQTGAASSDTFFTVGWASASMIATPPAADCVPLSDSESEPMIAAAATAHKLDPSLIRAVIRQESGFRPCAVSPKGAMGMMQLMPQTAEQFHLADPFNATENISVGAQYLKELMERFKGDLKLTLAAYNAGPGRVDGDPPSVPNIPETQDYVSQILKALAGGPREAQDKTK
jgi:soluble lytic murein transglycosylase-like protein